jgi:hypothetical protein
MAVSRKALALVALACMSACGKEKGSAPAAATTDPGAPLDVATLPAETRVIIGARVSKLLGSAILRRLVDQALAQDPDARARLESLLARCKLDLARDVERVTVAMAEPHDVGLLVHGRIDPQALLGCVRAEAGELTETQQGGRTVYATTREGNRVWLAFDGTTVVAATSERWIATLLDRARPSIQTRADTVALLAKVDRDAAVWGVGYVPPSAETRMGEITGGKVTAPPKSVTFAVQTDKDPSPLSAALRLELASPADATALIDLATRQRDLLAIAAQRFGLGRMVSKTQIDAEGRDLRFTLRLDPPDVRLLEEAIARDTREPKEQGR